MALIKTCVKNLEEVTYWELNGSLLRKRQTRSPRPPPPPRPTRVQGRGGGGGGGGGRRRNRLPRPKLVWPKMIQNDQVWGPQVLKNFSWVWELKVSVLGLGFYLARKTRFI